MDAIAVGMDANLITTMMSLNLSAAFNCVFHGLLTENMRHYRLDATTIQWMQSYLSGGSSYVSIGSAVSDKFSTPFGVPQGSIFLTSMKCLR